MYVAVDSARGRQVLTFLYQAQQLGAERTCQSSWKMVLPPLLTKNNCIYQNVLIRWQSKLQYGQFYDVYINGMQNYQELTINDSLLESDNVKACKSYHSLVLTLYWVSYLRKQHVALAWVWTHVHLAVLESPIFLLNQEAWSFKYLCLCCLLNHLTVYSSVLGVRVMQSCSQHWFYFRFLLLRLSQKNLCFSHNYLLHNVTCF